MLDVTVRSSGVASPRSPSAVLGPRRPPNGDRPQILIVEDDAELAELLAEQLELAGFSVVLASDAGFGLTALRTRQFALVLSDQRMPGKTGVEMLCEARGEGLLDGVAALIVSADPLSDLPWRALRKPISFEDLLHEVHRAIDACAADPTDTSPSR